MNGLEDLGVGVQIETFSAQINDKIRGQFLSFCASIQISARAVRGYLDRGRIRRFQNVMTETREAVAYKAGELFRSEALKTETELRLTTTELFHANYHRGPSDGPPFSIFSRPLFGCICAEFFDSRFTVHRLSNSTM